MRDDLVVNIDVKMTSRTITGKAELLEGVHRLTRKLLESGDDSLEAKIDDIVESFGLQAFYIPPDSCIKPDASDYAHRIRTALETKMYPRQKNSLWDGEESSPENALMQKQDEGTGSYVLVKDQSAFIALIQSAEQVYDQMQIAGIGLQRVEGRCNSQEQKLGIVVQSADRLAWNQTQNVGAALQKSGITKCQIQWIGAAAQVTESCTHDQIQGFGFAYQHAGHVNSQVQAAGVAVRYAELVDGDQITYFGPSVNIARHLGGVQGGLLNVVTEECSGKQYGLINYSNDPATDQCGLINLRPGKRWRWNVEIGLPFFSRGKK